MRIRYVRVVSHHAQRTGLHAWMSGGIDDGGESYHQQRSDFIVCFHGSHEEACFVPHKVVTQRVCAGLGSVLPSLCLCHIKSQIEPMVMYSRVSLPYQISSQLTGRTTCTCVAWA